MLTVRAVAEAFANSEQVPSEVWERAKAGGELARAVVGLSSDKFFIQ